MVTLSASVTVVAVEVIRDVLTRSRFVTGIVGARVVVVAIHSLACHACPIDARVTHGTNVQVITRSRHRTMLATHYREALVLGAGILVVTCQHPNADAKPLITVVPGGASIAIIALTVVAQVHATLGRVTHIVGADITVIADLRCASPTDTIGALIPHGTSITIVTVVVVGLMQTPEVRVASIIGA
jgi:hypothetical protein